MAKLQSYKFFGLVFVLLFFANYSVAQETTNDEDFYMIVDEAPEFPGGFNALMEYIHQNLQYPANAKELKIQGKVMIQVAIMKDGFVKNAQVIRSSGDESMEQEAIRIVQNMQKWKPAKLNGEVVNCLYIIPIVFELDEK